MRRDPDRRAAGSARKRIVLVGAGHAHLHCLRHAADFARAGHELVLIAPGPFWYSGLATGVLGGAYPPELACIDVETLAARGGAKVLRDRVTGLHRDAGRLALASGAALTFDAVSLDLGADPPPIRGESARRDRCIAAKPVHRLVELRGELEKRMRLAPPRVVVAGGGVTAFEVAANILGLAARLRRGVSVTVLAGSNILHDLPPRARHEVVANLSARGARIEADHRASAVDDHRISTACGAAYEYDIFVNATGLAPPRLAAEAGLPTDERGAMVVDRFLRSPVDPRIHGGGDLVAWQERPLPKAGVYAIRQGPVLHENLRAAASGSAPKAFVPQHRHLWIMNLGDDTGLAVWGTLWWKGRSALRLKDWIDRRFLRSFGL